MVVGVDRGTGAPPPALSVPRKRSKALEQAGLSQHKQAVQLPDGTKKKKKKSEPLPQRRGEQIRGGRKGNWDNLGQNKNKNDRERGQHMKDIASMERMQDWSFIL